LFILSSEAHFILLFVRELWLQVENSSV
jgi:hypothetical protein